MVENPNIKICEECSNIFQLQAVQDSKVNVVSTPNENVIDVSNPPKDLRREGGYNFIVDEKLHLYLCLTLLFLIVVYIIEK